MSDFDKEAERERLREKYERDQQKRQATQRMSDLLLKGATMTNRHCGVCGDPLFRYDGQEFCPAGHGNAEVPEGATDDEEDAAAPADDPSPAADAPGVEGGDGASESSDEGQATAPRQESTGEPGPDLTTIGQSTADASTSAPSPAERSPADRPPRGDAEPTPSDGSSDRRHGGSGDRRSAGGPRPSVRQVDDHADDLDAVYESVVRTIERMAAGAEESSDPAQVREYLAAAREAAETLNALDR